MTLSYEQAAAAAAAGSWGSLDFFDSGRAVETGRRVDEAVRRGGHVLPAAGNVFRALELTPPDQVRAVILGQDPYPTPGDAHGLAFSVPAGRRTPASLRTVFAALKFDLDIEPPGTGDLTGWARNGVLLLNVSLTVEAGRANAHRDIGWQALAGDVLAHLNARPGGCVFMLWGRHAQRHGKGLDRTRHCTIETPHPSPLAHGRGREHGFVAARPFARAKAWLDARALPPIDWSL